MASKFKPGIPENFSFDVGPVQDLGDYLDEPGPSPVVQRKVKVDAPQQAATPSAQPPAPGQTAAPSPVQADSVERAVSASPITAPMIPVAQRPAANDVPTREERGGKEKAPRREISMTPETLRMSDELLDIVRNGSGQRDTKANELFHALVLLVHEARDHLDPHAIPKRGRWGTPTARAYPLELKNAFLKALLQMHQAEDAAAGSSFPRSGVA